MLGRHGPAYLPACKLADSGTPGSSKPVCLHTAERNQMSDTIDHDRRNTLQATRTKPLSGVARSGRLLDDPRTLFSRYGETPGTNDVPANKFSFGPFCLLPTQFLLLEGDKPVLLGSRALEILIVLLERRGELVGKQELMARVWPNIFVEPANLTVHVSALRRSLRDGQQGNRFIINIPGRGYCFVAPVNVSGHQN
jgi:DNA-binding winged helix-turn-helix (wHTH) protein